MVTTRRSPLGGAAAGTAAGLVWGLAFLLPVLLHGWTAVTVTAGRYLAYGLLSVGLVLAGGPARRRLARTHWRPALAFAVTGNVGYYLLLVLGIEWVGAPVTDIVIGCIPVTVAVSGNVSSRAHAWPPLILAAVLVAIGLVIVNVPELTGPGQGGSAEEKALGLLAAVGAVVLWTWYGLSNARFLARHPGVPHVTWSTVVGLGTGVVTLALIPLALALRQLGHRPNAGHSHRLGGGVTGLVMASIVLGVLVSWAATALWNTASALLSTTVAGMLINVETVSGYGYVYAANAQWPPAIQLAGFAVILTGVAIVIRLPERAPLDEVAADAPAR